MFCFPHAGGGPHSFREWAFAPELETVEVFCVSRDINEADCKKMYAKYDGKFMKETTGPGGKAGIDCRINFNIAFDAESAPKSKACSVERTVAAAASASSCRRHARSAYHSAMSWRSAASSVTKDESIRRCSARRTNARPLPPSVFGSGARRTSRTASPKARITASDSTSSTAGWRTQLDSSANVSK